MIEYQTSPMKWCEPIYKYSIYIAEFWNSITSLSFVFFALYCYYDQINRNLSFSKHKKVKTLLFLMSLIGPTSLVFHVTLNFYAQFIDEVSVMIFLLYCMKEVFNFNNLTFYCSLIICSLISWYVPFLSPFILITIGTFLTYETKNMLKNNDSLKLWYKGFYYGITSIFLWILDFICIFNTHSWWHIFISLSLYHYNLVIFKETIYGSKGSNKIKVVNSFMSYLEDNN